MKGAFGQKYVLSLFNRGVSQDVSHDLPDGQVRATYITADRMAVSQEAVNVLKAINGDDEVGTIFTGAGGTNTLLAVHEMAGYIFTFWATSSNSNIRIFRNFDLIGDSDGFPGFNEDGYLYVDGNPDSMEMALTDNEQPPMILDMDDMYDQRATDVYGSDFDRTKYEVNQDVHLTQPVFRRLNNVGVGGGVRTGSYAYAYRMVSDNGDATPWSPPTPFIPVPSNYGQGGEPTFLPGAKTYGEAASQNYTKYGIDIAFRVVNYSGFDYVEVKRIPNNVGGPVEYTATPQYVRLQDSISNVSLQVINFTDVSSINWATLDDSNALQNSIIDKARTVRFYDGRLVLGGVTYESREFTNTDVFNDFSDVASQGLAYKENLGVAGYTDIHNQVYKKAHRCGERYGYAAQVIDESGSRAFALPFPDLSNFKFPERRDGFDTNHDNYTPAAATPTAALVGSDDAQDTDDCHEVYIQGGEQKTLGTDVRNIVDVTYGGNALPYAPLTPTDREDIRDGDLGRTYCDTVDTSTAFSPACHGHEILATGMKLAGFDIAKLPSWAAGISVLRSDPAGRVVAQGIGVYVLSDGTTTLDKELDKLWVYSPELDPVVGNRPGVFQDIIDNPGDYQIQLVSPVGWFPEFYSGYEDSVGLGIDFVSNAMAYFTSDAINPYDSAATTGRADGYASFGRWRNQVSQGSGIDYSSNTHIFDISAAVKGSIDAGYGLDLAGRSNYLEIQTDGNIYATGSVAPADASNSVNAEEFHEPFYIVNIIRSGANVGDNNVDTFKEIGHYIKLRSLVGVGNGVLNQTLEITSERTEDFHRNATDTGLGSFTYIYVNGQRWLNVTHWPAVDITSIRTTLDGADSFNEQHNTNSQFSGVCYGIYTVEEIDGIYYITFPYQTIGTPADIIPEEGDDIEVRYDSNQPISILLGDTVVAPAAFAPIDANYPNSISAAPNVFNMRGCAFPFRSFTMEDGVFFSPAITQSGTESARYETGTVIPMNYIRQWLVTFMCESTVNLPFVHKDFFPYRNYVMRPYFYDRKTGDQTVSEFLAANNIYDEYESDYPDEWLMWDYGGFHPPGGYNFDYNKQHRDIYSEKPVGVGERLDYPKRIQWGVKKSAASIIKGISRTLPVTNVYDTLINDATEINMLYSEYTGKGTNLYAVLDRGVVGYITDKQLLRDGVGDELGVLLSDGGFIQGELWIDTRVGSPDKRWRGRAEGVFKSPEGIHIPALVFPGDTDLYMLSGNRVRALGTNFRNTVVPAIRAIIDTDILTATFVPDRNELWIKIGATIYVYSFVINNWAGTITGTDIHGLTESKLFNSVRDSRIAVTLDSGEAKIMEGYSGYIFDSDVQDSNPNTQITFAVTPPSWEIVEFTDVFINVSNQPNSVEFSVDSSFTEKYTITSGFKAVGNDYRFELGRTSSNDLRLQGNTLYVRIKFQYENEVTLNYVKTGYKSISGG